MKTLSFKIFNFLGHLATGFLNFVMNSRLFRMLGRVLARIFNPGKDVLIKFKDHEIYANTADRIFSLMLLKYNAWEGYELELMSDVVKPGMLAVDVGANLGHYTLHLAKLVGPQGQVFAFEPEPENYRLLTKSIKKNQYTNISAFQKAVSDKKGFVDLYFCYEHRGDHRIYDSKDQSRSIIQVAATTIDDMFVNGEIVDVIKVDTQGAEALVFLGMENVMERNKDIVVFCEFTPGFMKKAGQSPEEFLNGLKRSGFILRYIDEKKRKIKETNINELMELGQHEREVNLFLSKK